VGLGYWVRFLPLYLDHTFACWLSIFLCFCQAPTAEVSVIYVFSDSVTKS
jgi:hypothetical protein